jgi:hypothetical protein
MIFLMAGGSRKSKQEKSNMAAKFVVQTWTNLTKFWHQNELKNIVWQREPVENTWKQS